MKKKGFVEIILLGFLAFASVIIFMGTTADEAVMFDTYNQLKKTTDSLAIALANHYVIHENQQSAETIAQGILLATPNGEAIEPHIEYEWDFVSDPKNVTVRITNFSFIPFWYKFLGKESFLFEKIESKANIVLTPSSSITSKVDDFIPLAINGCAQNVVPGLELDVYYRAYDVFNVNDNEALYALGEQGGGQSSFAHFKNTFHLPYDKDYNPMQVVSTYEEDADNDAKQLADAIRQNINDMDSLVGTDINIALLACESTAAAIVTSNIIPVHVISSNCGEVDKDGNIIGWTDKNSDCSSGIYRLQLGVLNRYESNVILEY